MSTSEIIIKLINKGGAINWVISTFYLLFLAVALERIVYMVITGWRTKRYVRNIENQIMNAKNKKAAKTISKNGYEGIAQWHYLTPLSKTYLDNFDKSQDYLRSVLELSGDKIIAKQERGFWILTEMGHIAPLLGLLGTVVGLIKAFAHISQIGANVEVSDLAGGIWEAMLTTANGLIVAIIAFLTHRIFAKIVQKRELLMSDWVSMHDKYIREESQVVHPQFVEESSSDNEGVQDAIW